VVDDASSDGSPDLVRERFPRVRLLRNRRNVGFARSINWGVAASSGRYLVLCNNDLLVREEFVGELLAPFDGGKERLFATSAKTVGWYDGKPNQLCMGAQWRGGRVTPAWHDPKGNHACLFVQAGAAAYRRDLWESLGGLSTLYEPGYWEDYDLSWRAAKAGMTSLYVPSAFALHVGGGSMTKRYGAELVRRMKARNHLLFEAANLTSPRFLGEWALRLGWSLRDAAFREGAAGLFPRLAMAFKQRSSLPRSVSDPEILAPWREFTPSF
jgi:GT2 family glycosyltransferase